MTTILIFWDFPLPVRTVIVEVPFLTPVMVTDLPSLLTSIAATALLLVLHLRVSLQPSGEMLEMLTVAVSPT